MHWILKWRKFKLEFHTPDCSTLKTTRACLGGEMKRKTRQHQTSNWQYDSLPSSSSSSSSPSSSFSFSSSSSSSPPPPPPPPVLRLVEPNPKPKHPTPWSRGFRAFCTRRFANPVCRRNLYESSLEIFWRYVIVFWRKSVFWGGCQRQGYCLPLL